MTRSTRSHPPRTAPWDDSHVASTELAAHRLLLLAYGLDLQALLVVVSREEFDDPILHESARTRTVDALAALVG